jgi:hypothetical protein
MVKRVAPILIAGILLSAFAASGGICVWSCQQNPSGSYAYWFSRALSDCPVTDCLPRNGSSPSGTACNPGDPDIPGDCRTAVKDEDQPLFFTDPPGGFVCSLQRVTFRRNHRTGPAPLSLSGFGKHQPT